MKFLKIFSSMLIAGAMCCFISACSDDDDPIRNDDSAVSTDPESGGSTSSGDSYDHYDEVEILVSVTTMTFNSTGGKWKISISATSSWSATGPDWVTIDPDSGTTYGDLTITASDNSAEGCASRTGTITFSLDSGEGSTTVTVRQNGYGEDTEDTGGSSGGTGDFGGDETLPDGVYYMDDFEWVRPYAEAVNQEDIVASNDFGSFAQYSTTSVYVNGISCQDELVGRGYTVRDYNGNEYYNVIVMPAYLLFYTTNGNTMQALHLPKLTNVPEEGDNVWMELVWCPSTNGNLKPDTVTLTVEITTGDTSVTFDSDASTAGTKSLYWSHHVFEVTGVTITEDTDICIRPIDSQWAYTASANRRYLVGGVTIYNSDIYTLN